MKQALYGALFIFGSFSITNADINTVNNLKTFITTYELKTSEAPHLKHIQRLEDAITQSDYSSDDLDALLNYAVKEIDIPAIRLLQQKLNIVLIPERFFQGPIHRWSFPGNRSHRLLRHALEYSNPALLERVLKQGICLGCSDNCGLTPLKRALLCEDEKLFSLIIQHAKPELSETYYIPADEHIYFEKLNTPYKIKAFHALAWKRLDKHKLSRQNLHGKFLIRSVLKSGLILESKDIFSTIILKNLGIDITTFFTELKHFIVNDFNDNYFNNNYHNENDFLDIILAKETLSQSDLDIIQLSIESNFEWFDQIKYETNYSPLHLAIKNNHLNAVKLLVHHGANIDKTTRDNKTCIQLASPEIATWLQCTKALSNKKLTLAVKTKNEDLIASALEDGANINARMQWGENTPRYTPLQYVAADHTTAEIAQLLVSNNANLESPSTMGSTPLFLAVFNKHPLLTKYLLDNGANINHQDNFLSRTVLHYACEGKNPIETIDLLIDRGADINITDDAYYSSFYYAVESGHRPAAITLLAKDANTDSPLKKMIVASPATSAIDIQLRLKDLSYYLEHWRGTLDREYDPGIIQLITNQADFTKITTAIGVNNSSILSILSRIQTVNQMLIDATDSSASITEIQQILPILKDTDEYNHLKNALQLIPEITESNPNGLRGLMERTQTIIADTTNPISNFITAFCLAAQQYENEAP